MAAPHKRTTARKPAGERRVEIAQVAMRILARDGHRRFTSKALAVEVGVTEGAIFRHFASMEAIADAIVDQMGNELLLSLERDEKDPLERLQGFFRHRAALLSGNPDLAKLLLSEHLAQAAGEKHAARVDAFRAKSQRFVRDCVVEAKRKKSLGADIEPETAVRLVMGALMSLGHGGKAPPNVSALIDELWRLIERALQGKEASR